MTMRLLDHQLFLVKEKVGLLRWNDEFNIIEPETGSRLGRVIENPTPLMQMFRLFFGKKNVPTRLFVYEGLPTENEQPVISISRGVGFLRTKVKVFNAQGGQIGWMESKLLSLGGGFYVYDNQRRLVAEVIGDWKGWNFRFRSANGVELGVVSKKWAGLTQELLTTANNYVIALHGDPKPSLAALLLAVGLAIDSVYRE